MYWVSSSAGWSKTKLSPKNARSRSLLIVTIAEKGSAAAPSEEDVAWATYAAERLDESLSQTRKQRLVAIALLEFLVGPRAGRGPF